jgi:hypothetical protein
MLGRHRALLDEFTFAVGEMANSLIPKVKTIEGGMELVQDRDQDLGPALDLGKALAAEADKYDLVRWLLDVRHDVLGAYIFTPRRGQAAQPSNVRIELYWAVIGLVSQFLHVSIEDLTAVVVAHELAHAYTHLGLDIDGSAWDDFGFATSDGSVKEGLAQYYTACALTRFKEHSDTAAITYGVLLERQPPDYHVQVKWAESFKPEQVRLAMLKTRRGGKVTLSDFEVALGEAGRTLP